MFLILLVLDMIDTRELVGLAAGSAIEPVEVVELE